MGNAKKRKILLLFDSPYRCPRDHDFSDEFKAPDWKAERDMYKSLTALGHDVCLLGLCDELAPLLDLVKTYQPDLVFNLAEVFRQQSDLEKNIICVLEMLGIPYTGASSASVFLCKDKALTKKILNYHKIKVPKFKTYYRGKRISLTKKLRLPLILKPLCDEASRGISLASVVDSTEAFVERVRYIHQTLKTDAIAEEYIPGREFYVGIIGHKQSQVFPPIEMKFSKVPDDEPRVATYKAKWDNAYRKKWGIKSEFPSKMKEGLDERIREECKKAYKVLNMRCYARFDVRVTDGGRIFIIEANANPCIAKNDEFAMCAKKYGLSYNALIQKIIDLSLLRVQEK